jgi:hypothetical protein
MLVARINKKEIDKEIRRAQAYIELIKSSVWL